MEKRQRKRRETFHHGDVGGAARQVALKLLDDTPHEKLSVRAIAEQVGVAHRAINAHFGDREGLINALATTGYDMLADQLSSATDSAEFIRIFISFVRQRSNLYLLMMSRPHATMKDFPELQTAVHRVITKAMTFYADPSRDPMENRQAVMKVQIILHGALTLRHAGILDVADDDTFTRDVVRMIDG